MLRGRNTVFHFSLRFTDYGSRITSQSLPVVPSPARYHRPLLVSFALTYLFLVGDAISSNATSPSDFSGLLNDTAPLTQAITTDQEALAVISSLLAKNKTGITATQRKPSRKTQKTELPNKLIPLGIQFIREIAIYHWAS